MLILLACKRSALNPSVYSRAGFLEAGNVTVSIACKVIARPTA
jgi:hypothetical protein